MDCQLGGDEDEIARNQESRIPIEGLIVEESKRSGVTKIEKVADILHHKQSNILVVVDFVGERPKNQVQDLGAMRLATSFVLWQNRGFDDEFGRCFLVITRRL
jgi:hypothetical protein